MKFSFTAFIAPILKYIDDGDFYRSPFEWLYMIFAGINLLIPLIILFNIGDIFDMQFKFVITFILVWLFIVVACWVGFQIWWNRKDGVVKTSKEGDDFIATPVVSHLVQTIGEWLGSLLAITGVGFSLFATLFLGDSASTMARQMGIPLGGGFLMILAYPVIGFLIIVVFRFIAETARALASVANNTR